jgi:hypothetical protein
VSECRFVQLNTIHASPCRQMKRADIKRKLLDTALSYWHTQVKTTLSQRGTAADPNFTDDCGLLHTIKHSSSMLISHFTGNPRNSGNSRKSRSKPRQTKVSGETILMCDCEDTRKYWPKRRHWVSTRRTESKRDACHEN